MSIQKELSLAGSRASFRERFGRYNTKLISSGDTVEVYSLEDSQRRGYSNRNKGQKKRSFADLSVTERIDSLKRKQRGLTQKRIDVMRLVSSNFMAGRTKFLTLTFEEHITDKAFAMNEFKKFVKRYNYYAEQRRIDRAGASTQTGGSALRYLAVTEPTKAGRIHFHVVLFNCDYIPNSTIAELWGNGFIKINNIKGMDGSAVARYVTKYIVKHFDAESDQFHKMVLTGEAPHKQKAYVTSTNLKRPKITYLKLDSWREVDILTNCELVKEKEYSRVIYLGEDESTKEPQFGKSKVEYRLLKRKTEAI